MLRHYSRMILYICDDTVSLQIVEILGEIVSLEQHRYRRVYCSTDLPDRMVTGWYRYVSCRMFLQSRYGYSDYSFVLCTTCLYIYDYTSSYPNLSESYDSLSLLSLPPTLPATALRLCLSIPSAPCV